MVRLHLSNIKFYNLFLSKPIAVSYAEAGLLCIIFFMAIFFTPLNFLLY